MAHKDSLHRLIEDKISELPPGAVFVTADFLEMADAGTASKTLVRLVDSGVIKRIIRGVYTLKTSEEVFPDEAAHAIARSNSWHIAPCGDTALYIAGLRTQKPQCWTYVTDGTYREYMLENARIKFLHTAGKLVAVSEKTALVIQVLKAYGKDRINDEVLRRLSAIFCDGDKNTLLRESQRVSEWINRAIFMMCRTANE